MKRAAVSIAGLAALVLAGFAVASGAIIDLGPTGPAPQTTTVPWADTVTFTNSDSGAQVVELPRDAITSPPIPPGGTFDVVMSGRGGNHQFRVSGGSLDRPRSGVIVVDAEGTVSLEAGKTSVRAGAKVVLSGVSSFAGKPVQIETRMPDDDEWTMLVELVAAEDGSFSTSVTPEPGSRFRAQTGGGSVVSRAVAVAVQPRLSLRANRKRVEAGSKITLTARVRPATAARRIDLERFDTRRKRWALVSRTRVQRGVAKFTFTVPDGTTRLRAAVRRFLVSPGFDAAVSAQTRVRGR